MNILKKASFNANVQSFVSIIIYIIFIIYSLFQINKAQQVSTKLFFILIIGILLAFAYWSEYLKHTFRKAIRVITIDCDPDKANDIYNDLLKRDKFNSYKNDKYIFDTLYYIDKKQYQDCLDHIEEQSKFFHSSLDQLLIYHFSKFFCSYQLNDLNTAKEEYNKLKRMKDTKVKGAKVSPLYNWDFLEAVYDACKKEYRQSYNQMKKVNTDYMNNREKIQYYEEFEKISRKVNDSKMEQKMKENIQKIKKEIVS